MTAQEALEIITNIVQRQNVTKENGLALAITQKAIEKQIPKKPDYEGDGYDEDGNLIYDTWICPNCGKHYEVDYDDYNCCPECGQAIKQEDL